MDVNLVRVLHCVGASNLDWALMRGVADSFSIYDIIQLMNVWTLRYELNGSLLKIGKQDKNQRRIYISGKSKQKLVEIVKSHMLPSMMYKIGL